MFGRACMYCVEAQDVILNFFKKRFSFFKNLLKRKRSIYKLYKSPQAPSFRVS
jgi:hypothetical protein